MMKGKCTLTNQSCARVGSTYKTIPTVYSTMESCIRCQETVKPRQHALLCDDSLSVCLSLQTDRQTDRQTGEEFTSGCQNHCHPAAACAAESARISQ